VVDELQKYSSIDELNSKIKRILFDTKKRHKLIKKYDNKFFKNFTDEKFREEMKNTFVKKNG